MKRILCFALVICILLTPALVSCHKVVKMDDFVMPEEFDTSREYNLTFWAKNDSNITQANIYKQAISDFEKMYPNIHITLKPYTDYSRIYNDVITNISTNTTPNICISYPDHIATYNSGTEMVVSLDELMVDEKYGLGGESVKFDSPAKDEMIPKFLSECYLDGSCYALPFMRSTEACYVNKTYVEKLGFELPEKLTWEFVWEVSDAAMALGKKTVIDEKTGKEIELFVLNEQTVMIPFIYKSTDNMMIQMLKQKGAGYSDEDGKIEIFNDTTEEILYTVAEHTKTGAFSTFKISGYPANFLNAGECIFAVDSTAGATWMGSDASNVDIAESRLVDFDIEVMTIPQYDTENPKMISQGPSVCIFNKEDPQEVMASWLFVQYLVSDKVQLAYAQTEGYVPVTTAAQNSEEYMEYLSRGGEDNELYYDVKIKATKLLIENTENTFVTPVFNGSASLRNAAGQMIEDVTWAEQRKKTVDDSFIDTLYKDMTSLYKLNEISALNKNEFGAFPAESVILLSTICVVWIGIVSYLAVTAYKKRKKGKKI